MIARPSQYCVASQASDGDGKVDSINMTQGEENAPMMLRWKREEIELLSVLHLFLSRKQGNVVTQGG